VTAALALLRTADATNTPRTPRPHDLTSAAPRREDPLTSATGAFAPFSQSPSGFPSLRCARSSTSRFPPSLLLSRSIALHAPGLFSSRHVIWPRAPGRCRNAASAAAAIGDSQMVPRAEVLATKYAGTRGRKPHPVHGAFLPAPSRRRAVTFQINDTRVRWPPLSPFSLPAVSRAYLDKSASLKVTGLIGKPTYAVADR